MNNKFITSNQFFNHWARTNRDPDSNYIHTYVSGGNDSTYQNWVKSKQIETKSLNVVTKYKWVSEKTNCFKCKSLDGKIFDYKPNVEEVAHAHCRCEVIEVSEEEAMQAEMSAREEIGRRDVVIYKLNEKSGDKSQGKCASYVTDTLKSADIDLRKIRDTKYSQLENNAYAYQYGNYLTDEDAGFLKISSGDGGKNPKSYEPKPGDIAIFEPLSKDRPEGHMQMYNGKNWVSDFQQNTKSGIERSKGTNLGDGFFPNQSYKDRGEYVIYRNPKWQDWEI